MSDAILDTVLGRPLASAEEDEQKIDVKAGIPLLGLDGLSSAGYGPEAAMTTLLPLGVLGVHYIAPIMGIILGLLFILYLSYRQTISAYPGGGGSYTVAKENLGVNFGLLAAASLLVDYILNVAVGISAGVGALVSAVPIPALQHNVLAIGLLILAIVTLVNLRGVRESGSIFALPTYAFVGTLTALILIGLFKAATSGGNPQPVIAPPDMDKATDVVGAWILLQTFANGCTAMTGVEAVSNGVTVFKEPRVQTAQKTLTAIIAILAFMLAGIAYLCLAYHIGATDPDPDHNKYQSVISMLLDAVVGRNWFYYVTQASVLFVLALSANTSFAGFPRLCHLLAHDNFLPHGFTTRGRRLVYTIGIGILTAAAGILLIIFGGVTDRLIPLFAVGAFGAFTLSQAGMVVHWRRVKGPGSGLSLFINGLGAICTLLALIIILIAKFVQGAWITLLLIPGLVVLFKKTQAHYAWVDGKTECLRAMNTAPTPKPVVVLPFKGWSVVAERALRFARMLSDDVFAVNVQADDVESDELAHCWQKYVEAPLTEAGQSPPKLVTLVSPYRFLFRPLFKYIRGLEDQYPGRDIAVIIPELVENHWYQYFLHNQRAVALKAGLFLWGGQRVVVINVPWYVTPPEESKA